MKLYEKAYRITGYFNKQAEASEQAIRDRQELDRMNRRAHKVHNPTVSTRREYEEYLKKPERGLFNPFGRTAEKEDTLRKAFMNSIKNWRGFAGKRDLLQKDIARRTGGK